MWEISNGLQLFGFLRAALLGGSFCLLYDILRALRRVKKVSDLTVFFEDLIYFILIAPITFCFFLALTNGELRAYIFIAMIIGFATVRVTVSVIYIKLFVFLFNAISKLFSFLKKVFNAIFSRFYSVWASIRLFLSKNCKKIINCFKKLLKKQ